MIPVPCTDIEGCFCHYDWQMKESFVNCSSTNITRMPNYVPNNTAFGVLWNISILKLCEYPGFLTNIKVLQVKSTKIYFICKAFANKLNKDRHMSKLKQIWLSDNPYHCDCDMIWMTRWLNNFTTTTGEHIIMDYQNVTCHS